MADDNKIQLTVSVNSQTGQLEVVGNQLQATGDKAKGAADKFSGLSGQAGTLLKSLLPFASIAGVTAFFKNAVTSAEDFNEAIRRLHFNLEASGVSWDKNRQKVLEWASQIQATTRFDDTEAISSLERFVRVTGNLGTAMTATKLAMGLSVESGKDLNTVQSLMADLLQGNTRSLITMNREFGNFTGGAKTAQEAVDNLSKFMNAAFSEQSFTKQIAILKNQWGDFAKNIGQEVIPVLSSLSDVFAYLIPRIETVTTVITGMVKGTIHEIKGMADVVSAVIHGNFKDVGSIIKESAIEMKQDAINTTEEIKKIWENYEHKRTKTAEASGQERLMVSNLLADEERLKAEEMERELEAKTQSLGQQTYSKKLAQFNLDVAARRAKINKEITDEVQKQKVLDKLNKYEAEGQLNLAKEERLIKAQTAFQVASLAVQTLQTVNSLGEQGSAAERIRAKALLALQQAIAIGWAWVNAEKAGGPFGSVLAAAETALILAQFAKGVKQIDQAASQEAAGIQSITTDTGVPGIDLGAEPTGVGGGTSGGSSGGSIGVSSSGGGGGAGTIINVGGIVVNFDIDKLSVDNIDAVMIAIRERIRQGTIEGIQLALQLQRTADRNSNLAA